MDDIQSKIAQARAAGYSDDEIATKVASLPYYADKFKAAYGYGYKPSEVIATLAGSNKPTTGVNAIPLPAGGAERMKADAAQPAKPEPSFKDKLLGGLEAAGTLATGATSGAVGYIGGALGGIAGSIANGDFGTEQGTRRAKEAAEESAAKYTYQPRTEAGQKYVQGVGQALEDSGVAGLPLGGEAAVIGNLAKPAASQAIRALTTDVPGSSAAAMAAQDAAQRAGAGKLRDLVRKPVEMSGVGAAETSEALLRNERAQSLPVPIDLTQGQKTRAFDQMRFEKETAKLPKEGSPLRERFAEQNDKIFQNMDAFIDDTGATAPNLRATGELVDKVLVDKFKQKKAEIREAYNAARESGDMAEMVDVTPLREYIEQNRPSMRNAPIIATAEDELNRLTNGGNMLSINDMEELRKTIGKSGSPNLANSNAAFAPDLKNLIDATTADKGGPLYQQARRMYENFANEFKNKGVINKLMRTKPGTTDRAVAFEDVMNHVVDNGSLDDLRAVRRTLQTAGEDGKQAWKEIQGAKIADIKNKVFGSSARDENGNPVGSAHQFNKIVNDLDADGKLDFLFGRKGAQQLRDARDIALDVYTAPPGAVNTSGTASVLIGLMDTAVSGVSGMPLPIGTALNYGIKKMKSRAIEAKVNEALGIKTPLQTRVERQRTQQQTISEIGNAQSIDEAINAASKK